MALRRWIVVALVFFAWFAWDEIVSEAAEAGDGVRSPARLVAYQKSGSDSRRIKALHERGAAAMKAGDSAVALAIWAEVIEIDPRDITAHNRSAWIWATCSDAALRDGKKAVESASLAGRRTDWINAHILDTLAAAHAESGDFDAAVAWERKAIKLETNTALREAFRSRLALFETKTPYRETKREAGDSNVVQGEPGGSDWHLAEERAGALGLKAFRTLESKHFTAVGNTDEAYLRIALQDCEAVTRDFLEYYMAKGWDLTLPERRMVVVVLEDERAFDRFIGRPPASSHSPSGIGGLYMRKENWLVLKDYRRVPVPGLRGLPARTQNLQVLAHEVTHMLTFNIGILNRPGDVPMCVTEGLAVFGEIRRENARVAPGQLNRERLKSLAHVQRKAGWIPVAELLTEKMTIDGASAPRHDMIYAEGYLLVHYFLSQPDRAGVFRAYLAAIADRRDDTQRLDDARTHLGDLEQLDDALKLYARKLVQSL